MINTSCQSVFSEKYIKRIIISLQLLSISSVVRIHYVLQICFHGSFFIFTLCYNFSEAPENLIFERKQSARIVSCQLPLQIAWYNLLSFHPEIERKILLYEPLQLEELYSMFKNEGYKYHIEVRNKQLLFTTFQHLYISGYTHFSRQKVYHGAYKPKITCQETQKKEITNVLQVFIVFLIICK